MTVAEMFEQFMKNLAIDNVEQISDRYSRITRCLNKQYRDTDSNTANTLQVGSYGRRTAIKGISDLDMIYFMPQSEWERFENGRQSALLQEIKNTIQVSYPKTDMSGDGQVVVISFDNQVIEVVPGFEDENGNFTYPDTNNGGTWRITKPRLEIQAIADLDKLKNGNLRDLCKMLRAWKDQCGVNIRGYLIDTLAYNFFNTTTVYDDKSYMYYDEMLRDFFKWMSELPKQNSFVVPGSNQHAYVKSNFQRKAKEAYESCLKAIDAEGQANVHDKWKEIFGRPFPSAPTIKSEALDSAENIKWRNTEQFIEDRFPIKIVYNLKINCVVSQKGFQTRDLREMIARNIPLQPSKKLMFSIASIDVPQPYAVFWKVLNRGIVARQRDEIRGQIDFDRGHQQKEENTRFKGNHIVECYIVKDEMVVAKDRIDVPISE